MRLCDRFDGPVPDGLEVSRSFRYERREPRSAYRVDSPPGEVSMRFEDIASKLGYFN